MIRTAQLTRVPITPILSLALLFAGVAPLIAQSPNGGLVTLPDHVVNAVANMTPVPHTVQMDGEPITITVVLNLSDPAGASALKQQISDPNSPNFHQTMSPAQFAALYGPTEDAYNTVLSYLQQNGFALSTGSTNRRTLTVHGTRGQAQKAFNVVINDYQRGTRTFHAIASNPAVSAAVAPLIAAVAGLTNLAQWQPASGPYPYTPMSIATAYNGTLTPAGKTNSGGLPPGLDGTGQTIGLIEFDGFDGNDVKHWLKFAGLPASLIDHLTTYPIEGGATPSGCTLNDQHCGTTEALLDIDAAMGIAQGANIEVFSVAPGTDFYEAINTAGNVLSNGGGGVLSMSWGECEGDISKSDADSVDSILSDLIIFGVTLFAATGDSGATCTDGNGAFPNAISFPADAANAIAVGGTSPNVNSANAWVSESWWLNSGGFGVSQFVVKPGYQSPLYPSASHRSVPDVSIDAATGIVVCQASPSDSPDCGDSPKPETVILIGGTSLATPLWAATLALVNQASVDAGTYFPSPANGYFYSIPQAFHSASSMTGTGNDFAHVGLGSPDITKLVAITIPPRIDSYWPENGPAAGGTKITITGAGFVGVEKVAFGGVDATNLTIESDTKLTVETPVAPGENATIKVVTPGGTAAAGPYLYNPEITGINQDSGPMQGGTMVTVTGRALANGLIFVFGTSVATKVNCTASTCTMVTPAQAPGRVNVVAETAWGYGYSPSFPFTYQPPAVTGFSPAVGPTISGVPFLLFGTSLQTGMTVNFGDSKVTGVVSCSDPGHCNMTTPSHAAGLVPLTVTVDGITSAPSSDEFTFLVFPTITSITPNSIPLNTGTTPITVTLILRGTAFSMTPGDTVFSLNLTGLTCSTTTCTGTLTIPVTTSRTFLETPAITVTVNGNTSQDSAKLTYPVTVSPPPPPPCKGTDCH